MGSASRTRKRSYTWDDFVALPDDDRRELIDGELVEVEVVPGQAHERIVSMLLFYLVGYAMRRGGLVLASGYKVRVGERRGVMPDVQYFAPGNEPDESHEDGLVEGRPDIAVEIMSKTSRRYDRIVKLGYYLQEGLRHPRHARGRRDVRAEGASRTEDPAPRALVAAEKEVSQANDFTSARASTMLSSMEQ